MLRPGGVFFGVAPDANAILSALGEGESGPSRQLRRGPPEHPFALFLHLLSGGEAGGRAAHFGSELVFSLQDTVTEGQLIHVVSAPDDPACRSVRPTYILTYSPTY